MRSALAIGAVLFLAAAARGQTGAPAAQGETDLARIRARIAGLQARLSESEKAVATLSEEINRLDWRLELGQQETRLLAAQREGLTRALAATRAQRLSADAASGRSARALLSRARVLHRFGRYGYLRVLLEAGDARGFLRAVERLDALARRDGRLMTAHRGAQQRLEQDLAREEALKSELDQNWAKSRRELVAMSRLRASREALLSRERHVAVTGKEEVHALSDKADRLERLLSTLARQSSGETADASSGIRPWKGVLDWPARGAVIETFGRHRHPRFDAWTNSNGIAVAAPVGTPVRAVYAGKTVYAQWLAEYGNLVILDHGDGIFTLYAWLQNIAVPAGSVVPARATLGSSGSGPGRSEPGVYFEIRDRQRANDPVAWLR